MFSSAARQTISPTPLSTSEYENLFLRDLQASMTYALTATIPPAMLLPLVSMTPDGHFVAFYGYSAFDGNSHLYVWDSQAAALIYTNSTISPATIAISPDGNRIVYSTGAGSTPWTGPPTPTGRLVLPLSGSHAGLQFSGDARFLVYSTTNAQVAFDTNGVADVYLYDFVTRSNFLVSQGNPPGAASGPSDSPVISNDGRFVAYRSTATNLVAGATNGLPNVFLYDRQTGTTTLLSANTSGNGRQQPLVRTPIQRRRPDGRVPKLGFGPDSARLQSGQ